MGVEAIAQTLNNGRTREKCGRILRLESALCARKNLIRDSCFKETVKIVECWSSDEKIEKLRKDQVVQRVSEATVVQ